MSKSGISLALLLALMLAAAQMFGQANQTAAKEPADKLIAVLKSDAPYQQKADACRQLATAGTKDAVAPLAAMLGDEKLSHMARYALEPIPDPAVDDALRDALGKVKGRPLVGVIGSIGVRRDPEAVEALAGRLQDADADVAQAAARALGRIGTSRAAKALNSAWANVPAGNQLAFCEGLFRCAEALAARGQRDEAMAIYDRLRIMHAAHQVRAGALRGAILTREQDGLPLLRENLRSKDYVLLAAACRTTHEMPGHEVTQLLAAELSQPQLPAGNQVLVIQTLGQRADPAALPALFGLAKSGGKSARLAAIRALAQIGEASAAPVLAGLTKDADPEIVQAAQESLTSLPGAQSKPNER